MNLTWAYVGVLYALAVWLLRRAHVELPRRVALLFFALALAFLWRPLTSEVTLIPADVIRLTPPFSEMRAPGRAPVDKYQVSNLNLHDIPMQLIPWTERVRDAWRSFEVPLWDDSAGCGYPLLANGQSTPLSPLRLVTLPLSLNHAMTAEAAMRLLIALVLTFLFCRTRYSKFASVVAAIAYAFSTWMTVWLQFPIASAAAFLPGVLLCIETLLEEGTRARFIAAALLFATTVLSGHPETVFHIGLIAAAFGFWVALVERRAFKPLLRVAGASVVAALIASPFLVPFAEAVM
ncbi:MAG TPA: YfhO family protein, partial [Thermoanaerobaculia bacterium]|nr:YfhO family protein [Thermoanaerobaculia bacterium]